MSREIVVSGLVLTPRITEIVINQTQGPRGDIGPASVVVSHDITETGGNVAGDTNAQTPDFSIAANEMAILYHDAVAYIWTGTQPVTLGATSGYTSILSEFTVVGNSDHALLVNREVADQHPISSITGLVTDQATQDTNLTTHINDVANPHAVTAAQTGAAESIHTHTESDITDLKSYLTEADHDFLAADNPHSVTATQTGAYTIAETDVEIDVVGDALTAHMGDVANPHGVTAAQLNALQNIIEDTTPQLGGSLQTKGNNIVFSTAADALQGALGINSLEDGVVLVYSTDGLWDSTDSAVECIAGGVIAHGTAMQVKSLEGTDSRQVYCSESGILYSVVPPAPGWEETDTDTAEFQLPTLGLWVEMTNLVITVPQDVLAGARLDVYTNLNVEERGGRSGSIAIGVGVNGAQPLNEFSRIISVDFSGFIPVSLTTTTHGGLTTGDTVSVWVQKDAQDHASFDLWVDGAISPHELIVSVPGEGGSGGSGVWGSIIGTLSDQGDLNTALGLKSDTGHAHSQYEETPTVSLEAASFTVAEADGFDHWYSATAPSVVVTIPTGLTVGHRFTVKAEVDTVFGLAGVTAIIPEGKTLNPYADNAVIGFVVTDTDTIDVFGDLADI